MRVHFALIEAVTLLLRLRGCEKIKITGRVIEAGRNVIFRLCEEARSADEAISFFSHRRNCYVTFYFLFIIMTPLVL